MASGQVPVTIEVPRLDISVEAFAPTVTVERASVKTEKLKKEIQEYF